MGMKFSFSVSLYKNSAHATTIDTSLSVRATEGETRGCGDYIWAQRRWLLTTVTGGRCRLVIANRPVFQEKQETWILNMKSLHFSVGN